MLKFLSSWCSACSEEMRSLRAAIHAAPVGIRLPKIIVVGEFDSADTFAEYSSQLDDNFGMVLDSTGELREKYQIHSIPSTTFIDVYGNTVSPILAGPRDWNSETQKKIFYGLCRDR